MGTFIQRQKNIQAFTLVEIMLVVIIIAALAAMVVPRFVGKSEQARKSIAQSDITQLATALKIYELDNGGFPTTAQGLSTLLTKTSVSPMPENWNGPYIEKEPIDPWNHPYVYVSPGKNRPDYDLYSKGKDENSSDDDITNW